MRCDKLNVWVKASLRDQYIIQRLSLHTVFSGIVETTTHVLKLEENGGGRYVWMSKPSGWILQPGESVCVQGVCSTVQQVNRRGFGVVYMAETLRRSTLGSLRPGERVNLERSLTPASLIGGHVVQGHVDTTARITGAKPDGEARIYEFTLPARFCRYLAQKGSVAVDGISLTVIKAGRTKFAVSLLDYTMQHTTLGTKGRGDLVNVEVDILAKYVERLLAS